MECPKCHQQNRKNAVFCAQCGHPLPAPEVVNRSETDAGELMTESLILVTPEGGVRALLTTKDGKPMFCLYDEATKPRAMLSLGTGAELLLLDDNGKERVSLGAGGPTTSLSFMDSTGSERLSLSVLDRADELLIFLKLADGSEKPRIVVGLDASGPYVVMSDENGHVTWAEP